MRKTKLKQPRITTEKTIKIPPFDGGFLFVELVGKFRGVEMLFSLR